MKKLLAGILTLSLVLAACGNDDNKKEDDQKDKDKTTQQSDSSKKDSNKDQSKEDKNSQDSKDSKDGQKDASNESSSQNKDNAASTSASDSSSSNQDQNASNSQSSDNGNSAANNNASSQNTASQSNNNQAVNNGSNTNSQGTQQTGYVPPYQGQNAVPAASTLGQVPANQQTLKVLPNFPQSLATAQSAADAINGPHAYNDYGIQNDGNGKYSYLFSFANQNNPGTYTIVSVNQQGQAAVLDPAYAGQ